MRLRIALIAALATAWLAMPASAVTITSINSAWQDTDGRATGEGTNKIRWGKSDSGKVSGYNFRPRKTNFEAPVDTAFSLGKFTHLNFPITGSHLKRANLLVNFTIGGVASSFDSMFAFRHLESLNSKPTCANGNPNGVGVNVNGCADRVKVRSILAQSDTFVIGGFEYVLEVIGFQTPKGPMKKFWTVEGRRNSAQLLAVIRTVGEVPPENPPGPETPQPVPLPASGLLLLAGVAGLMLKRRRA